jgi:hypothetical protein
MACGRPNEIARASGEPGFNRLQGLPIAAEGGRLLVMSLEDPQRMVGSLIRASLLGACTRQRKEEAVREHGWLVRFMKSENELKAAER